MGLRYFEPWRCSRELLAGRATLPNGSSSDSINQARHRTEVLRFGTVCVFIIEIVRIIMIMPQLELEGSVALGQGRRRSTYASLARHPRTVLQYHGLVKVQVGAFGDDLRPKCLAPGAVLFGKSLDQLREQRI